MEPEIIGGNDSVEQLKEIFPDIDPNIIYEVLIQCEFNTQVAIEILFASKDDERPEEVPKIPKESFMGLSDSDLDKIRRDLDKENAERLKLSKQEDEELQKAITASMKQLKVEEKKREKDSKKNKEVDEKPKPEKSEEKNSKKKISFGQKIKNLFSRKKKVVVEEPEDIEIPDIKYPPNNIQQ